MKVIGVDIGGVIIQVPTRITKEIWRQLQQTPDLDIPPVAPLSMIRTVLHRFECVHLVSAASPEQQERIFAWFKAWNVWKELNLSPENVHFCSHPSDKGALCRLLPNPPTVFIDDTPEALECLRNIVPHRFFLDRLEGETPPRGAERVQSWEQFETHLRKME